MSSAFRQAVYASCGLKNSRIEYKGSASPRKARSLSLAIDSFLLYTDFGKKVCTTSLFFIVVLLVAGIVGLGIGLGWLLNVSLLAGILLLLNDVVFLLYYAQLILKENETGYLISNIEKIQKG